MPNLFINFLGNCKMKYLSIILLALAMALASCSKNSTNPTDNNNIGGNSAVVKSDKGDLTFKLGFGAYDIKFGNTEIGFTSYVPIGNQNPTAFAMAITFQGNSTGSFDFNPNNDVLILKDNLLFGALPGKGKINITKYGAVGQTIEGTFSGQFISSDGLETFTVTSASFKAIRLPDEDDNDPDDDLNYSYMEIQMTINGVASITFSDDRLEGAAAYDQQSGTLTMVISNDEDEEEMYRIGISIVATGIQNQSNQTVNFNESSGAIMYLEHNGTVFNCIGTAVIQNFAQSAGTKFEVTGSCELFSTTTGEKAGDIQNFKIRVIRIS